MTQTTFGQGTRVAAKEHPCVWCTEKIAEGEAHHWWSTLDDGRMWTQRCHAECESPLRDSATADPDWLYCDGNGPHGRGEVCSHD